MLRILQQEELKNAVREKPDLLDKEAIKVGDLILIKWS